MSTKLELLILHIELISDMSTKLLIIFLRENLLFILHNYFLKNIINTLICINIWE